MFKMTGEILTPSEMDVSAMIEANGSATVTISNLAPSAVGTATIGKWLKVRVQGVDYYIPMWT